MTGPISLSRSVALVAVLALAAVPCACLSSSSNPSSSGSQDAGGESDSLSFIGTDGGATDASGNVVPDASDGATPATDGSSSSGCGGDGDSGTFTCVGSMITAREAAAVAALPNGKALVAGGWNATNKTLTSAEVYDSATGTFAATGSMSGPHLWGLWNSLPVLSGGKVLVAGGLDATGALVGTAEVYDATAGTFSLTGSLVTPVISMFPLVLSDQSVLLVGGWNSVNVAPPTPGWTYAGNGTSEVQRYASSLGTFADTAPLAESRLAGCDVALSNGKVLAIGGSTGSTTNESNVEQYDPLADGGTWTTLGTLSAVPACGQAYLLPSGKVLMVMTTSTAGSDVLDPTTLSTTPTTGFPAAWTPYYVQLATGDVLAYGGTLSGVITANAMVYSATTSAWTSVSPMGTPRGGAMSAVLLSSGEVLIVGGTDAAGASLASAEVYHP